MFLASVHAEENHKCPPLNEKTPNTLRENPGIRSCYLGEGIIIGRSSLATPDRPRSSLTRLAEAEAKNPKVCGFHREILPTMAVEWTEKGTRPQNNHNNPRLRGTFRLRVTSGPWWLKYMGNTIGRRLDSVNSYSRTFKVTF